MNRQHIWIGLILMSLALLVLGIGIAGFQQLGFAPLPKAAEIQMGLIIILAIGLMLFLLYIMVHGFAALGLASPQHALGLPDGSIRALIALFLIMIFVIVSAYLFRTINGQTGGTLPNRSMEEVVALGERVASIQENGNKTFDVTLRLTPTEASEKLALQLSTVLGTLVTAVSAFYFGSAATRSSSARTRPTLTVDMIDPAKSAAGTDVVATIIGAGFATGARVKLTRDGYSDIIAHEVKVLNTVTIRCTINLAGAQKGRWDVVVVNSDKTEVRREDAFEVQ